MSHDEDGGPGMLSNADGIKKFLSRAHSKLKVIKDTPATGRYNEGGRNDIKVAIACRPQKPEQSNRVSRFLCPKMLLRCRTERHNLSRIMRMLQPVRLCGCQPYLTPQCYVGNSVGPVGS